MNHSKQGLHEFFDQSFARFRSLPSDHVESACDRVLERLRKEADHTPEALDLRPRTSRRYGRLVVLIAATAAAAVFAQQVVKRKSTPAPSVKEAVVTGSRAPETAALVQQTTPSEPEAPKPPALVGRGGLKFAAASIKSVAPGTILGGAGLACHGKDGVQRVLLAVSPDAQNAIMAAQGRCFGSGVFLSTLIEFAYGVSPHYLFGGPDWTHTTGFITSDTYPNNPSRGGAILTLPARITGTGTSFQMSWLTAESFQIEAVADDPSTATLEQLRQMLRGMLTERFNLQAHRERRAVPGYSLVVAEKGPKLKQITSDYDESVSLQKGRSTLDKLARTLSSVLLEEAPIIDKTGLNGAYEYELHIFPLDPFAAARGTSNRGGGMPPLSQRAENLSSLLEQQLGLRLQPEKAVSVEALVIDSVESPSPN